MRLVIDARPLVDPSPGGVGRVARLLIEAYAKRFSEDTITCITTGYARPDLPKEIRVLPNVHHVHVRIPNKLWTVGCLLGIFSLEQEIRKRKIPTDLLLLPNLGFVGRFLSLPYALLLHDLAFLIEPRWFYKRDRRWFHLRDRMWHRAVRPRTLIREATVLFSVSETTKQDAMNLIQIPAERIHVLPLGPTFPSPHPPLPPTSSLLPPHPYALAFGNDDPRKNIATVVNSIRTLRQEKNFASLGLVIIGGHAAHHPSSHDSWIHMLTNVNDAERNYLMKHADVFLYPSWYEGYGLPLHEAAALGIRRVASTSGALPETAPPGTIFANPAKPHHWTEAIKIALQTKPQTVQPTHTWDESAEKLHDILAKI